MSLDFDIYDTSPPEREPCPHCGQMMDAQRGLIFTANITHNLAPMWREAGVHEALYESDGKRAADLVEALSVGVEAMGRDPGRFRALDAPNGWGTYDQALSWLNDVRDACAANPDGVIRISR